MSKKNENTEPFCYAPWHSVALSPDGSVGPCCIYPNGYSDAANGSDTTGADAINIWEKSEAFRQDILDEKLNPYCQKCLKKESKGIRSMRSFFKERVEKLDIDKVYDLKVDRKDLIHLDFSLGNVCNFKCVYCHPGNSSKWIPDAQQMLEAAPGKFDKQFGDCNYSYNYNPQSISNLVSGLENCRFIELKGGEPFLSPSHIPFLQDMVDSKMAKRVGLEYTTNGSIYCEKSVELLKKFRQVDIAFSFDGLDEVHRVSRGTNLDFRSFLWPIFLKYKQHPELKVQIHITVNITNIISLPEFAAWLNQEVPGTTVSVGIVEYPDYLNFLLLSEKTINNLAEQLVISDFSSVQNFAKNMNSSWAAYPHHERMKLRELCKTYLGNLAKLRNFNLTNSLPSLAREMSDW